MINRRQMRNFFIFSCILLCLVTFSSSCNSLKPVVQHNSLQTLNFNDISKFDGEYNILSSDTSYPTLAHALTFSDKKYLNDFNHLNILAEKDVRLKIKSIDDTHLKITVYRNNKVLKTKILRGKLSDNYFQFTSTKISSISPFYLILNRYRKQENRIGLLENGDLTLDSYEGGVLLLFVMPTFGGDSGSYNLIFKRRNSSS
jgi:hypothetical protein